MQKVLINYATREFKISQKLNSLTGLHIGGFDRVINYGPKNISKVFRKKNAEIFNCKRGGGYWIWKPYIILKTLKKVEYGDIIFYCDSGALFIDDVKPLIDIALNKQDILCFNVGFKEKKYTKRDAFVLMDCDRKVYSESDQRLTTFIVIKKTTLSINFFNEFLNLSLDRRIISDDDNVLGHKNYPGFIENRHDQTIFSLLTKKYKLKCYRDPSVGSHIPYRSIEISNYNQILKSTRKRHYIPHKNLKYFFSVLKIKIKSLITY